MTVEQDLQRSADAFSSVVYPEISHFFGDAQYVSLEACNDAAAAALDMGAGIDGIVSHDEHGVRGVAARVHDIASQGKCWSTITHRYKRASGATTEHEKRKRAVENKNMTPYYTVQAYVDDIHADDPTVEDALACRTRDLLRFIDDGVEGDDYDERFNPDPSGKAWFYSVPFENIEDEYPTIRLGDEIDEPWHALEPNGGVAS